ncbi:MAG: hypothetical protein KDK03_15165 [Rhodobacteraceae bacterium]|nr:hypothetical protein [Paracoccaceae bacterium]
MAAPASLTCRRGRTSPRGLSDEASLRKTEAATGGMQSGIVRHLGDALGVIMTALRRLRGPRVLSDHDPLGAIIGESPVMPQLLERTRRLAGSRGGPAPARS